MIGRKSILNLSVSLGGIVVAAGGDGDFVDITAPQKFGSKTGVHGDVTYFDTPNNVYEISLSMMETSPLNEALQNAYAAQQRSSSSGPTTMVIADIGTGERLSGPAMIMKEPDRKKSAEVATYTWLIHLASVEGTQYQTPTPIIP